MAHTSHTNDQQLPHLTGLRTAPHRHRQGQAFHLSDQDATAINEPRATAINAVLTVLDRTNHPEHPDVSPTNDSEWRLSVFTNGFAPMPSN